MVDFLLGPFRVKNGFLAILIYLLLVATVFFYYFFQRDYETKINKKRVIYNFIHGRKFFCCVITEPVKKTSAWMIINGHN